MKKIVVLGSTGSIGQNVLKVARHLGEDYQIIALAARENIDLLEAQIKTFNPELVAVYHPDKALELQRRVPHCKVLAGMEGLLAVATFSRANFVVSSIAGTLGLQPTVAAIKAGKNIGLANKEALVSGGSLVMRLAQEKGIQLIPIDSEHSAIFQCLNGENKKNIHRIILTASGGPFRNYSSEQLDRVTLEQALCHPNWKMGPKVTIDCSTLLNKGLEVIEAHWLFNLPVHKIEVMIHPQSIIHSLVEFVDYSMLAQMGEPNMITPIQYALTYPERAPGLLQPFDFIKNRNLDFSLPDLKKFKCLHLAYEALRQGGSLACYMNAANEILIERFLKGAIKWKDIGNKLEELMQNHKIQKIDSLETILAVDTLAREEASRCEVGCY